MCYEKLKDKEMLQDTVERAALFYPDYLLHEPEDARARPLRALDPQHPDDLIIIYNAACFYSLLGDKTESIRHLKRAIDNGFRNFDYIKHDPDLFGLKEEPEFMKLLEGH